ncbi:MAG TPA: discoidin domain-containing protein, partial [Rugosimonospora sp.]
MNSVPTPSRPPSRGHPRRRAALCIAAAAVLTSALTVGFEHAAQAADTLLSQDRIVTVSSTQVSGTPGNAAVDSNSTTRWASAATDNEWIMIDLSTTSTIDRIHLQWEAAYAKAFQLQTSADAVTWTTIYSTTNGTGGTQDLNVSGTGRYVR